MDGSQDFSQIREFAEGIPCLFSQSALFFRAELELLRQIIDVVLEGLRHIIQVRIHSIAGGYRIIVHIRTGPGRSPLLFVRDHPRHEHITIGPAARLIRTELQSHRSVLLIPVQCHAGQIPAVIGRVFSACSGIHSVRFSGILILEIEHDVLNVFRAAFSVAEIGLAQIIMYPDVQLFPVHLHGVHEAAGNAVLSHKGAGKMRAVHGIIIHPDGSCADRNCLDTAGCSG